MKGPKASRIQMGNTPRRAESRTQSSTPPPGRMPACHSATKAVLQLAKDPPNPNQLFDPRGRNPAPGRHKHVYNEFLPYYDRRMSQNFRKTIGKRNPFDLLEQEVYLHLWRTMDLLNDIHDELFRRFKVSPQQFNVLRILRGHHPTPVTTSQVRSHLVAKAPDVTRLVDRLQERGLVSRETPEYDGRVIHIRLSKRGRQLLSRMDGPLLECHKAQLGHLSHEQLTQFDALLDAVRQPLEPTK